MGVGGHTHSCISCLFLDKPETLLKEQELYSYSLSLSAALSLRSARLNPLCVTRPVNAADSVDSVIKRLFHRHSRVCSPPIQTRGGHRFLPTLSMNASVSLMALGFQLPPQQGLKSLCSLQAYR